MSSNANSLLYALVHSQVVGEHYTIGNHSESTQKSTHLYILFKPYPNKQTHTHTHSMVNILKFRNVFKRFEHLLIVQFVCVRVFMCIQISTIIRFSNHGFSINEIPLISFCPSSEGNQRTVVSPESIQNTNSFYAHLMRMYACEEEGVAFLNYIFAQHFVPIIHQKLTRERSSVEYFLIQFK